MTTSRRETIMAAVEARIKTVFNGPVRRVARADDDRHMAKSELPAVDIEMRRDAPKSANEQTERTLEFDIAVLTAGSTRVSAGDAVVAAIVPALLTPGADLPKVRIREGDTTWIFEGGDDDPVLRTVVAISIGYRTEFNSIN